MGWLWSSSTPTTSPSKEQPPSIPPTPEDAPTPHPPTPAEQKPPRALTRDEQAEAELQSFLQELSSETSTTHSPAPFFSTPRSLPPPSSDPDSIHPSTIYPSSMSCRAAFDSAYQCQLPGGQFTNVYRYGQLRNCSELWSNFWFCMRTNRGYMSEEDRAEKIRKHYWERDEKYRSGPSSEDVWKIREKRVEEPFMGDFEAYERQVKETEGNGR